MQKDITDNSTKGSAFPAGIYKKPPRAETHKPVSVSNDTHKKLVDRQLDMQYRLRRKVSLDEVIQEVLDSQLAEVRGESNGGT